MNWLTNGFENLIWLGIGMAVGILAERSIGILSRIFPPKE